MKKISVTMTDSKVEIKNLEDQIYVLNCLLKEKDNEIKNLKSELSKFKHLS